MESLLAFLKIPIIIMIFRTLKCISSCLFNLFFVCDAWEMPGPSIHLFVLPSHSSIFDLPRRNITAKENRRQTSFPGRSLLFGYFLLAFSFLVFCFLLNVILSDVAKVET